MQTIEMNLPEHWLCALFNGDQTGFDKEDEKAFAAFVAGMVKDYGQCWPLCSDESAGFLRYHDASRYGVLACDCAVVTFDVTSRGA